jgi:chemotaxis protein MotB
MPLPPRREHGYANHAWPGWVDALSSLLMVVIFVLLVFTVSQFFLQASLSGRDMALSDMTRRMNELTQQLNMAQITNQDLRLNLDRLTQQLATKQAELDAEKNSGKFQTQRVDSMSLQMAALREEMDRLNALLIAAEQTTKDKDLKIVNLGQRLNAALASRVEELARYRSEFFGRLSKILGQRSDILVVGDRFIFQSEVLFASGSATLEPSGQEQLAQLAQTLKELSATIPDDLDWVLRIDGHTDIVPIKGGVFASNWELSTARAVSVLKFMIDQGIPARRLAAAGFAEFQPIAKGNDPESLNRNRRIEIKFDQH